MKKTAGVPVKKKRNRNEVVMDLKDMVVQKRMASLNATAILAASYEKGLRNLAKMTRRLIRVATSLFLTSQKRGRFRR